MPPREPNPSEAKIQTNQDSRPTPDPTILTTQMVLREVAAAREILDTRIKCIEENVVQARIRINERPAEIARAIGHLTDLQNEKFRSIAQQFTERDTRTEQTARDTKVAVDAALQAAEKAVGKQNEAFAVATAKSEAATTKQIDAIGMLISTTGKNNDDKINDLKNSITTINALLASINGRSKGIGDFIGWIFGAVALIIAALTFALRH